MQDEVIKLVLLCLVDGRALNRKSLVMFVVQRLEDQYPQASKTSIGHVVQLLYRASCFKVRAPSVAQGRTGFQDWELDIFLFSRYM